MQRQLLVQSCSASKSKAETPMPALDRYRGYFFKIINKAKREGELDPAIDICILSAEYGLLEPDEDIPHYDRRMDADRAEELRPEVVPELREKVASGNYDRVLLNMGEDYRRAVKGFETGLSAEIEYIEGAGIGEKGHQLKQMLRTDEGPGAEV
jgi:cytoplasmic iron level regulating protein YaaA (DUF328/UPF0246 family)